MRIYFCNSPYCSLEVHKILLTAYNIGGQMERKNLGKRINEVRKDRGFTADKLSEACNINARSYLALGKHASKPTRACLCYDTCSA